MEAGGGNVAPRSPPSAEPTPVPDLIDAEIPLDDSQDDDESHSPFPYEIPGAYVDDDDDDDDEMETEDYEVDDDFLDEEDVDDDDDVDQDDDPIRHMMGLFRGKPSSPPICP